MDQKRRPSFPGDEFGCLECRRLRYQGEKIEAAGVLSAPQLVLINFSSAAVE